MLSDSTKIKMIVKVCIENKLKVLISKVVIF